MALLLYLRHRVRPCHTIYALCTDPNNSFSVSQGVPAMMHEDWVIVSASRENSLGLNNTAEISKLVRISRLMAQVNATLGCSPSTPTGGLEPAMRVAFIKTSDQDIQELQVSLSPMKPQTQLYLHMARLHLHVFELISDNPHNALARTKSVLAAVTSATEIMNIATHIPALYYPFSACMYISMAAVSSIFISSIY